MAIDLNDLQIKIFADGADRDAILALSRNPLIKGFTTNPTLMRTAGVTDYEGFAREILELVPDRPISFEVLSDEFDEMVHQALKISAWGEQVYVKIPVTNCRGESSAALVRHLASEGVQLNVTALMTASQVQEAAESLTGGPAAFVSVFAGRIADTGRDPLPVMCSALEVLAGYPRVELIWASPREILNVFQADSIGCQVITVTHDLLRKLAVVGKDLDEFSLETVRMFFDDANAAGYSL